MTMTMRRFSTVARFASLIVALCPVASYAADLPFEPGRVPVVVQRSMAIRPYTAMQWPIYSQPDRFDIYGNPVGRFLVTLPDPLVVNNGCPKALQPTYDDDGNLAGYAPIIACR